MIEILVVLGIAALLAAITISAFSKVRENNVRATCQTNLSAIYTGMRQYMQDYDGEAPYYNRAPRAPFPTHGSLLPAESHGLELLFSYSDPSLTVRTGYLKSASNLHCPRHDVGNSQTQFVAGTEQVNDDYLSYQVVDNYQPGNENDKDTYSSFRQVNEPRQLMPFTGTSPNYSRLRRPPADDTVVTWCKWHRKIDNNTGDTIASSSNTDIVLYYDGTIRTVPINTALDAEGNITGYCETPDNAATPPTCVTGWKRPRPPVF